MSSKEKKSRISRKLLGNFPHTDRDLLDWRNPAEYLDFYFSVTVKVNDRRFKKFIWFLMVFRFSWSRAPGRIKRSTQFLGRSDKDIDMQGAGNGFEEGV